MPFVPLTDIPASLKVILLLLYPLRDWLAKVKVDVVFTACQPLAPLTNKLAFAGSPAPLVPVELAPLVLEKVKVGVAGDASKSCCPSVVCPHAPALPPSANTASSSAIFRFDLEAVLLPKALVKNEVRTFFFIKTKHLKGQTSKLKPKTRPRHSATGTAEISGHTFGKETGCVHRQPLMCIKARQDILSRDHNYKD